MIGPAPATDILLISSGRTADLAVSLPAAVAQPNARVTVIDNGGHGATAAIAEQAGAEVLRLDSELTWCAANNHAIARTDAPEVLLLNADCFLTEGFLARLRPRLWQSGVGSAAPKLLRAASPSQPLAEIDAAGMVLDRRRKNNLVGHGAPADRYATPGMCFGADGAAALYRREMLEDCAVAGEVLDEEFEKYASDVDLAWRGQLRGWRCAYEPAATAHHVRTYSPSTRAQVSERARRLQFRNRYLMMAKNETARSLVRDLPWIAAYEILALGHVLLRERHLLAAYADAWRLRSAARRRRRVIQARRRVDAPPFALRAAE